MTPMTLEAQLLGYIYRLSILEHELCSSVPPESQYARIHNVPPKMDVGEAWQRRMLLRLDALTQGL